MLSMTNQPSSQVGFLPPHISVPGGQTITKMDATAAKPNPLKSSLRCQSRVVQPGESVFFQGDRLTDIYLLERGWAFRHQMLEDGRRQIIDFILPGDVIGFGKTPVMLSGVEALTPCVFASFSRGEFNAGLAADPALSLDMLQTLSASQDRAYEHLTNVGRRTARERVANLLLELVQRIHHGQPTALRLQMTLPVGQAHLADALGLSGETVCRSLADLRKQRIVVLRSGRLDVLDFDALAEEAGVVLAEEAYGYHPVKIEPMRA
jgi:CRP-like cAMP-binding protein